MDKQVIFAFRGDMLCFMHVLLNVLDMDDKGIESRLVFEGEAVKLVKELEVSGNPLYAKAKAKGLIDCICRACSSKLGVLDYNKTVGIPMCDEMAGHPSMASYTARGYKIITM
ncbi:MAG: cytoplasmic protein [Clostridia bacterium]